ALRRAAHCTLTKIVTRVQTCARATVGVQLSTPVLASSSTPVGAETRPKLSVLAGRSASLAVLVTTRALSSLIVWSAGTVSTGALFTSRSEERRVGVAQRGGVPMSVSRTVIKLVLGPCASVGLQVSTPALAPRRTPVGAETRPKLSLLAGRSASLAVLVTTRALSSLIVWSAGTISTGALFTSRTTTMKLWVALMGGAPLSVTRTVIKLLLGACASVGVQVSTRSSESRRTPVGAETRPKVNVSAGMSSSMAVLVTTKLVNSLMVWLVGTVRRGALFTLLTVTT